MSDVKLEELVQTYLTIRTERNTLKNAFDSKDAELKDDLEKLEQAMLSYCNEIMLIAYVQGVARLLSLLKKRLYVMTGIILRVISWTIKP